jgi:hypothetical protein
VTTLAGTVVEFLRVDPETPRAHAAMEALRHALPSTMGILRTVSYAGGSDWLLLWGPGEARRLLATRRQVATGGRAIVFDLAYWSRQRKVRVSIDAPHPQAWVMRQPRTPARLLLDCPPRGSLWQSDGPILIAEIGEKARQQYGAATVRTWEDRLAEQCRARWPKRTIIRRPKRPAGLPIDASLAGTSLVITWHSNVAIDAIRLGIPVVCRDGAAAAVSPSELPETPTPLPIKVRDQFLANLAWFQWDLETEARACWAFLEEMLA